jgi:flagellar motility protein MotE (MotC chaperone)
MYTNMKPKDAARIFDRLDMTILAEVATKMNPRIMSAILAQMKPETAERLTVELANRAGAQSGAADPSKLPKIEGRPSAQ